MLMHPFPFDPTYGYSPEQLQAMQPPVGVADFAYFWRDTYRQARALPTDACVELLPDSHRSHTVHSVSFNGLGGIRSGGWLLLPKDGPAQRGVVMSHGYGGRTDYMVGWLPKDMAVMLPCAPGFHRSARADIPDTAGLHVVHGIASRETYVIRWCVAAIWSAATVLLEQCPQIAGRLYFHGGSFGGGLGALAVPWDDRIQAACLEVPTFGHHASRLQCPCVGSGEAVRAYALDHPDVVDVLAYYDAAVAAKFIAVPVIGVPAYFDPAVPPPGQWAVINACAGPVDVCPISAGHFDNPTAVADYRRQRTALESRFV